MADEVQNQNISEVPAEAEEDESVPFPRARVMKLIREEIKDKIIRSEVKEALNMWLGELTRKLAKEMGATQYASVSLADFQRATKPYDMIEDILKDEQRLLLSIQKLREDADHISRELNRFFATLKGGRQRDEEA
ncbi:MAG: hypothetical protein QW063_02275 [Candidatus Nanoarchaeia archaeon]